MTTNDANRAALLDKIAKLLALGDSARNTSENEAAAALAHAHRLMERHKIDAAALAEHAIEDADATDEDVENAILDANFGAQMPRWRWTVAAGIARANGCSVYETTTWRAETRSKGVRIHILGTPSDAAATRYMYLYAVRQIDDMCVAAAKANGNPGRTWCANFRIAAALRVNERVREAARANRIEEERGARERGVSSTALARVSDNRDRIELQVKAAAKALNLRNVSMGASRYDHHAREAGRAAGDRVNLGGGKHAALGAPSGRIGSGR